MLSFNFLIQKQKKKYIIQENQGKRMRQTNNLPKKGMINSQISI